MFSEASELFNAVCAIIEERDGQPRIEPAWVATEAMIRINFPREMHPAGYAGCHLAARQMARKGLRKTFEDDEERQHPLFPGLQKRYPVERERDQDPEYVLLELLTEADIAFNVARLRAEGRSKLRHADRLEDYGARRQSA